MRDDLCNEQGDRHTVRFKPKPLIIGSIAIDPPLILAPLAGISDAPFRQIAAEYGAGLVTTGMVSVEGLRRKQPATWSLLAQDSPLPVPLAVQVFGCEPSEMAEAARLVEQAGAPLIDINAGCPVRKILRQGAGASLLKRPDHLAQLVEHTRKAVTVPITVKIRLGWDARSIQVVEVVKRLESAGADAVTVHARTAAQKYKGMADWEWIRRAKDAVAIPVIGNGDVTSPLLADRMLLETGCDGIMIGRACMGNPWLLSAIASRWNPCPNNAASADWKEFLETALGHASSFLREKPHSVGHLRMLLIWYSRGCPNAGRLRGTLMQKNRVEEIFEIFRRWTGEVEATGISFLPVKVTNTASRPYTPDIEEDLEENESEGATLHEGALQDIC